ncbi:MAG: ABC transporter permease [Anaerolineae bacterium]
MSRYWATTVRRLAALIRTEFLNEFSSRASLVFFLVLPVLFTAAVGAGLSGTRGSGEQDPGEARIPIYVTLEDEGPLVEAFLAVLMEVNLEPERVDALPEEGFGLEVPADFSAQLLDDGTASLVLHTLSNSSASPAVEQAVMAARGRVGGAALVARMGLDQAREAGVVETPDEARRFYHEVLDETLAATARPPARPEIRWPEGVVVGETRDMTTSAEQASAGQIVTWVQITLLGAAEVLVSERLGGTLRRMLVMPVTRATLLGGKLLARLLLGLVQIALLLVIGALVFGVGWGRNPVGVALVSLAFACATVSLGILVATFVRTRGQANSIVVGMSMALAALGGAWFPLEVTPPLYRQVVQFLPSTWAMRAYTALLARNASVSEILPHTAVLGVFALVFATAGVVRFVRYRLE